MLMEESLCFYHNIDLVIIGGEVTPPMITKGLILIMKISIWPPPLPCLRPNRFSKKASNNKEDLLMRTTISVQAAALLRCLELFFEKRYVYTISGEEDGYTIRYADGGKLGKPEQALCYRGDYTTISETAIECMLRDCIEYADLVGNKKAGAIACDVVYAEIKEVSYRPIH